MPIFDSQIIDSIKSGTTDKLPSSNAVFDALKDGVDSITGSSGTVTGYTYEEAVRRVYTFNSNFIPFKSNGFIDKVLLQSDGKILIAGAFTNYGVTGRDCLIRLNSDGTLDTSFCVNASVGKVAAFRYTTSALTSSGVSGTTYVLGAGGSGSFQAGTGTFNGGSGSGGLLVITEYA